MPCYIRINADYKAIEHWNLYLQRGFSNYDSDPFQAIHIANTQTTFQDMD